MQEWTQRKAEPAKSPKSLSPSASPLEIAATVGAAIDSERANTLNLDAGMRERLKSHFGPMASKVKFVESDLPASFGAKAIAQGDTVRVAPGAYAPGTESGERMLSHELGHIVQQSRGEGMGGIAGMPMLDTSVERGADAIAESAMAGAGPVMTAAPAPAASAPMLGLGLESWAILLGWLNRPSMSREEIEEIDKARRMVADRAWKVTGDQFRDNKFNPTNNERLQEWQDDIDYAFFSGACDQEKALKMLYYFTKSVHSPLRGRNINIAPELRKCDPNGLRERLLNMARGIINNPAVADSIESFEVTNGNAVMSVTTKAASDGTSPVKIDPFQTAKGEDMRFTPAPAPAPPPVPAPAPAPPPPPVPAPAPVAQNAVGNGGEQLAINSRAELDADFLEKYGQYIVPLTPDEVEERRQKMNQHWYSSKLGQLEHHSVSDGTYAGNHEIGHLASLLLTRKRNGNNGERSLEDFREARTDNDILRRSIRHLCSREIQNKYEYDSPQKHGGKQSILTFLFGWLDGFGKNVGDKNQDFFATIDPATGEWVPVLKKHRYDLKREAMRQMALDPDTALYKAELGRRRDARAAVRAPGMPAPAPGMSAPAANAPNAPRVYDRSGIAVSRDAVRSADPFDPEKHMDLRFMDERNLDALFEIGETSAYGTTMPTETIAEAFADVDAHGKNASRFNKQVYKHVWRALNPVAAVVEYLQKCYKKMSQDPNNRYYRWAHRDDN